MSKVQEYLKNKKIKELGLPKIWVVKSDRDGANKPIECQVTEVKTDVGKRNGVALDRYTISEYPYEIDIVRGLSESLDKGFGTGVGDLWAWTYYCSLSKSDAEQYYIEESKRVSDKYESKNI